MSTSARSGHDAVLQAGAQLVEVAACSDIGTVRRENQDAWAIRDLEGAGLALVLADGMGGHADGAVAAYLAVTSATDTVARAADPRGALAEGARAANEAIAERRAGGGPVSGTTLVAAVVRDGAVGVVNVGDSRAYVVRGGTAVQLTVDHSWLAEQVRLGVVDVISTAGDRRRNVLTRALTGDPVDPDLFEARLEAGDALVLCSDGVWDVVDDAEIAAAVAPERPLREAVEAIVALALANGSQDNATVVACRVRAG